MAKRLYQKAMDAEREIRIHKEEISQSVELLNKKHDRLVAAIISIAILIAVTLLFVSRRYLKISESADKNAAEVPQDHSVLPTSSGVSSYRQYLVSAEIFKQTPIYSEITELLEQKCDKDTKILNYARQ